MLKVANQSARFCYEQALKAERWTNYARTPEDREFWLNAQKRWLGLATNAEFCERIAAFVKELKHRHGQPICLSCDALMHIRQIRGRNGSAEYHYECATCEAKQTIVEN